MDERTELEKRGYIPAPVSGMDCLHELDTLVMNVTPEQLQRAASQLKPMQKGEKALGTLHNETCKRLWWLMDVLASQGKIAEAKGEVAATDEEKLTLRAEEHRFHALRETVRELFWLQTHGDIGSWSSCATGVRENWMIVEDDSVIHGIEVRRMPPSLKKLLDDLSGE